LTENVKKFVTKQA